jgi:hypothetical protein
MTQLFDAYGQEIEVQEQRQSSWWYLAAAIPLLVFAIGIFWPKKTDSQIVPSDACTTKRWVEPKNLIEAPRVRCPWRTREYMPQYCRTVFL